jgi:photosystem II stability/assembly factor-like uncharacterized protein
MASATEGWAVGHSGTILYLTGARWQKVASSPTEGPLHSVAAASAAKGWVVGSGGVIATLVPPPHWQFTLIPFVGGGQLEQ